MRRARARDGEEGMLEMELKTELETELVRERANGNV